MRKIWVYCKNEKWKELVEKTDKNDYICTNCNQSLLSDTGTKGKNYYISMNPYARQTKMETTFEDIHTNAERFNKWVKIWKK